jgi:hypothetical protein
MKKTIIEKISAVRCDVLITSPPFNHLWEFQKMAFQNCERLVIGLVKVPTFLQTLQVPTGAPQPAVAESTLAGLFWCHLRSVKKRDLPKSGESL